MSISIRTTKSGKVTTPMIPDGWNNGLGLRNQIKREIKGIHTSRKDNVFSTNEHVLQAHKRIDMIGEGFGSNLVVKGQERGKDLMRKVDYSGVGGSTAGIGEPLGKVPSISTLVNPLSIIRESIRGSESEGLTRQSVYNVKGQNSNKIMNQVATSESRGIKIADSSAVRGQADILRISTVPTKTYTSSIGKKSIHESSPFKFKTNMVRDNNITIEGKSGTKTLSKFDLFRTEAGKTGQIANRTKTSASAHKTYLPQYESNHQMKKLDSKIKALDVDARKSDPMIYKRATYEKDVELKPTRRLIESKVTPSIVADKSPKIEKYIIKNERLRLGDYQSKSGAFIPSF